MISKATGFLVASWLLVSCGGASTSRRTDCGTLRAEQGIWLTLEDPDCLAALFDEGTLRLPQKADYNRPVFEISSVDPAVIKADYVCVCAHRDVAAHIFLKASETHETALPSTVTVTFGDPRTVVVNRVEVRLDGPRYSRLANWIHDGVVYDLNVLISDSDRTVPDDLLLELVRTMIVD